MVSLVAGVTGQCADRHWGLGEAFGLAGCAAVDVFSD